MKALIKKVLALILKKNDSNFTKDCYDTNWFKAGEWSYGCLKVARKTNRFNVTVGKFCSIAKNVKIFLDNNHRVDWISTYPFFKKIDGLAPVDGHPHGVGDVVIGNDVFIGQDVLIMSGVNIGDGAVIASRAVVTKDVRPYEIVGGIPAKHISSRFSDKQIKKLLEIGWWNWPLEKIKENAGLLQSENLDMFIKRHDGQ